MRSYIKYRAVFIFAAALLIAGCASQAPYLKLDPSLNTDIRVYENVQYVPLIKLCEAYGIEWKWDSFIRTAVIKRKNGKIILRPGSDRILVNGEERKLGSPVIFTNGAVFVPVTFVKNDLGLIVEARRYVQKDLEKIPEVRAPGKYSIRTIVIDAGHGGKDPGAIGRRLRIKERDRTLLISKKLKGILEDNGIRVIMTRSSDEFVSLPERVRMANSSGADLFVSIHINASRSRSMNGFECYYLSEATNDNARALEAFENAALKTDEGTVVEHSTSLDKTLWDMKLTENRRESAELAGNICNAVDNSLITRNRGVKTARFYVIKFTRIPSVLVEVGYLSNKFEELKLKDDGYADRMADVIAKGILAYKNKYERTEGFTL
ncbi:MAG: N-acetylmuramoyl-L-alanine amidase [Candidatus Omnitrophota bacterium]|nr:N-acetylmuramoyl-L-alanine amidase [Candidatus Omnitrophota bacterium]